MFLYYILLTSTSVCLAYMNPRLENVLNKIRQKSFYPAPAGSGERAPGAYEYASGANDGGADGEPGAPGHYGRPLRQGTYGRPLNPHLDNTYFCAMPEMVQKNAILLNASEYPYMARVVHTRRDLTGTAPLICTAIAIKFQLFLTAASCIATAKTYYTTIIYQDIRMTVKAFILPSVPSKQLFDDVGLIAVYNRDELDESQYAIVQVAKLTRTPNYNWFEDWELPPNNKIIGFIASYDSPESHSLYRINNMHASNSVCNKIYPMVENSDDYWTPCVHSCSVDDHLRNSDKCRRYLFGLGHAMLDKYNHLIGVVSWSCGNRYEDRVSRGDLPLPLGLAVSNKETFDIDVACAELLVKSDVHRYDLKYDGYHQSLCNATYDYSLSNPYRNWTIL